MSLPGPPTIESKALPTTPAHEWADSTTDALNTSQQNAHSEVSTPGPDIPGSYRADPGEDTSPTALSGASAMLATAKQYLPSIPPTLASYFPGSNATSSARSDDTLTTLPPESHSDEKQINLHNLPVGDSEESRSRTTSLTTESESLSAVSTTAQAGSSTHTLGPGTAQSFGTQPEGRPSPIGEKSGRFPEVNDEAVPTVNGEQTPKNDLSRKDNSENHIQSPGDPHVNATPPRSHPLGNEGSEWKGVSLDEQHKDPWTSIRPNTDMPDSQHLSTTADTGHSTTALPSQDNTGSKFQELDSSPPDLTQTSSPVSLAADSKSAKSLGTGTHSKSSSTESATGENETPTKSRFRDRIKGEVKVLSGKLGKNEQKIEEGRRLIGKV